MSFRVLLELQPAFRQWLADPDGRHHILQWLARTHMHVDVAHGDQAYGRGLACLAQLVQPNFII